MSRLSGLDFFIGFFEFIGYYVIMNTTKTCSRCQVSRLLIEYKKDKRNKDGLQSACTTCHKQYQQKRRAEIKAGIGVRIVSEKKCNRCQETKSAEMFYKDSACSDNLSTLCKVCRNGSMQNWRDSNRDKYNKNMRDFRANNRDWAKDNDLRRCYGIGLEEYAAMFEAQNGLCAKCKRAQEGIRPLVVDHDPTTTKETGIRVRALLCYKCNRDQHVMDNKEAYDAAVAYDLKHKKPA